MAVTGQSNKEWRYSNTAESKRYGVFADLHKKYEDVVIIPQESEESQMAKSNEVMEKIGVEVPDLNLGVFTVTVIGESPLITHAWSEKAKKMMLDKQMKKATSGREAKDPYQDFCESMYWLDGMPENPTPEDVAKARFGFPVVAFKAAAVDAGYQSGILAKKTTARGAFHIMGEMAEINGVPEMREDMVRIGMGTADIRYRAEFKNWSTTLTIRYNKNAISVEQIMNLLNVGGFACGVGEWRPGKDGSYGMFHVAREGE